MVRVNPRFNVIYVTGCVPGHRNTFVRVTDAIRKPHETPPPFPTHFPELAGAAEEEEEEEEAVGEGEGEGFAAVHIPHLASIEYPNRYAAYTK